MPRYPSRWTSTARRARRRSSRLIKFKDELADLRENMDLTPLGQTKNLQGAVGPDSHAERSLITSKVGAGSGRHHLRQLQPRLRQRRRLAHRPRHHRGELAHCAPASAAARRQAAAAASRRAARRRSRWCSTATRARIYALYARALRDNAELQGKLVLEFTIAPAGEVTDVPRGLERAEGSRARAARSWRA